MGWKRDWYRMQQRAKFLYQLTENDPSPSWDTWFNLSNRDHLFLSYYEACRKWKREMTHPKVLVDVMRGAK